MLISASPSKSGRTLSALAHCLSWPFGMVLANLSAVWVSFGFVLVHLDGFFCLVSVIIIRNGPVFE